MRDVTDIQERHGAWAKFGPRSDSAWMYRDLGVLLDAIRERDVALSLIAQERAALVHECNSLRSVCKRKIRERDERIEKLEATLKSIAIAAAEPIEDVADGEDLLNAIIEDARRALEGRP